MKGSARMGMTVVRQHNVDLSSLGGIWSNIEISAVQVDDVFYYPLTHLCRLVGVTEQYQTNKAKDHPVISPYLKQCVVDTGGGRQEMLCLDQQSVGYWLGTINPKNVRDEVRPKLIEFQRQLLLLADKLLKGEILFSDDGSIINSRQITMLVNQPADVMGFMRFIVKRLERVEDRVFLPDLYEGSPQLLINGKPVPISLSWRCPGKALTDCDKLITYDLGAITHGEVTCDQCGIKYRIDGNLTLRAA